jgi:hypothetical protein
MAKKEVSLTFRVTPEFDHMLRVECGNLGMDMAEYIRQAIMLGRPILNEYTVLKLIRLEDTTSAK